MLCRAKHGDREEPNSVRERRTRTASGVRRASYLPKATGSCDQSSQVRLALVWSYRPPESLEDGNKTIFGDAKSPDALRFVPGGRQLRPKIHLLSAPEWVSHDFEVGAI